MTNRQIVTFGCRLNAYESEVIRSQTELESCDELIVFNTCAVTGEAVRQARQAIRKARREKPESRIVVTGCAAQIEPASFAAMSEVDLVLGNEEKLHRDSYNFPDFGVTSSEKIRVNDIMSVRETAGHMLDGLTDRARAFVQIQNGCDHRCTFCIIPFGRGNSRSVPLGAVIEQVRHLVENGYREIVLTGVDLTSYGVDLPGAPTFSRLVRTVLRQVPELRRLRISSIDCIEVDDDLLDVIGSEERLMPHLHLSLQSGDDMILKRMKRRHSRAESIRFCDKVRSLRPDMVFGADIIAGFPTETDDMFARSLDLVEECGLTYLHVFPYSPRPGTPAAKMPQIDGGTIKQRARVLRQHGGEARSRFFQGLVGERFEVLAEKDRMARTPHFAPVRIDREVAPGDIVTVEIGSYGEAELKGRVI